jgi:hypothetical protein
MGNSADAPKITLEVILKLHPGTKYIQVPPVLSLEKSSIWSFLVFRNLNNILGVVIKLPITKSSEIPVNN